jgi:hypothetical protein
MAAVMAGAVAAALIAKWVGQQAGRAAVSHSLALGHPGTQLNEPLTLGGAGALMFWAIAAGLVAGGIVAVVSFRDRLRDPRRGGPRPELASPGRGHHGGAHDPGVVLHRRRDNRGPQLGEQRQELPRPPADAAADDDQPR